MTGEAQAIEVRLIDPPGTEIISDGWNELSDGGYELNEPAVKMRGQDLRSMGPHRQIRVPGSNVQFATVYFD